MYTVTAIIGCCLRAVQLDRTAYHLVQYYSTIRREIHDHAYVRTGSGRKQEVARETRNILQVLRIAERVCAARAADYVAAGTFSILFLNA